MSVSSQVSNNELPLSASLTAIFLCFLFGANATAIKISLSGLGVFTTTSLRFSIASLALFVLARWSNKSLRLNRKQFFQVFCVSFVFFMQMTAYYYGQNKTTAAHGTLIANALPFVVMVLAHYLLPDDRINCKKLCGLILGFGGVLMLFFEKTVVDAEIIRGDLTVLCAVLLWSGNVIYLKKIIADFNPIQITFYMMLFSLPFHYSAAFFLDDQMIRFISPEIILSMLYQGLVTASFGYVMWNTMVQRYGATALHSFVFLVPYSGVFFGVLLLGESVTPRLTVSICLVTAGLLIVNYRGNR